MSRVYFHDRTGEAEIFGWERAHMGSVVDEFGFGLLHGTDRLDLSSKWDPDVRSIMTPDTRAQWDGYGLRKDSNSLRVFLGSPGSSWGPKKGLTDGETVDEPFHVWLNTCHAGGSDPVKLFARFHAQCEIHCWMEGADRAWVADIIDRGRSTGLYREGAGWEQVAAFLRARDDSEVVLSYSVTDSFPDAGLVVGEGVLELPDDPDYPGEKDWDHWYRLSEDERWDLGVAALRKQEEGDVMRVQITEGTWDDYYHGYGLNAFKLNAAMQPSPGVRDKETAKT